MPEVFGHPSIPPSCLDALQNIAMRNLSWEAAVILAISRKNLTCVFSEAGISIPPLLGTAIGFLRSDLHSMCDIDGEASYGNGSFYEGGMEHGWNQTEAVCRVLSVWRCRAEEL